MGNQAAEEAENRFKLIYQKNQVPENAPELLIDMSLDVPVGEQIVTALVSGGFFKSKSEIRRVFNQGGVQYDGEKVLDPNSICTAEDGTVLKAGKNKYFIIKCV